MKKLIMGWSQHGHSVQLVQNKDHLEIIATQRGCPPRSRGLLPKKQLVEALNIYHEQKDLLNLVLGRAS